MDGNYIFHVHTWRCGHAEEIEDEAYVRRAIELGAGTIFFTDHAPFPGDPFGNRMKFEQMEEYKNSLKALQLRYEKEIEIKIGFEVEFLPSFSQYYETLRNMKDVDLLILGQHHSEIAPGRYSFELEDKSDEWKYLMEGQIAGAESGYFDVVAHPDRLFKREKEWTPEMGKASEDFLRVVKKTGIPIERNLASMRNKGQYWEEFWQLVPEEVPIVTGSDAHSVDELEVCKDR